MKINILALVFLIISMVFCSTNYVAEQNKRALKTDLIELADVKYGIFNIDEWKEKIVVIVSKKIEDLRISGDDKEMAKIKIEAFLRKSISKFESSYRSKSGFIKNIGADYFDVFGELKNEIPTISSNIIHFLDKKENADGVKKFFKEQLDEYSDNTFQKIDYSKRDAIFKKYNSNSTEECQQNLITSIDKIDSRIAIQNTFLILVFLSMIFSIFLHKNHPLILLSSILLVAFLFLIMGVLLPMINIDARISSMEFQLLGEPIVFENQILYFKSKSILEMAKIMLTQSNIQVFFVGLLVLIFSVVFPLLKLISTLIYAFNEKLSSNKVIRFITFKTGKWSMADVMVIAIFMTYIGFDGILTSQLTELSTVSKKVNIITTNHSELQNGFFYFIAFVLLSLSITSNLKKKKKPSE